MPADGPGAFAGISRRIFALFADWLIATFLARLIFSEISTNTLIFGFAQLAVFLGLTTILIGLFGSTIGHLLLGIGVRKTDGSLPGLPAAAVRQALVCLVIPIVVWDDDGRGLHDKAAGTVCVAVR